MKIVKLAILPLALLMLGGCAPKNTSVGEPTPAVATALPYIKGTGISLLNQSITAPTGETISLIPSNSDHLTVISLWCPSCFNGSHAQLQELANLHSALGKRGVRVVVVAYDTPSQEISEAVKNMGLSLDIGTGNKTLYDALNITSIPTTWYVDSAGAIVKTVEGFEGLEEMYADIEEISRSMGGPEGANLRISAIADPIVSPTPAVSPTEAAPVPAPSGSSEATTASNPSATSSPGTLDHSVPPVSADTTIPAAVTPTLSATPKHTAAPTSAAKSGQSSVADAISSPITPEGETVPLLENNQETPAHVVDTSNEAIKTETAQSSAANATASLAAQSQTKASPASSTKAKSANSQHK